MSNTSKHNRVRVAVRVRPLLENEGNDQCVRVESKNVVIIRDPRNAFEEIKFEYEMNI